MKLSFVTRERRYKVVEFMDQDGNSHQEQSDCKICMCQEIDYAEKETGPCHPMHVERLPSPLVVGDILLQTESFELR